MPHDSAPDGRSQPGDGRAWRRNLATGFFQGFPISSSSSRTPLRKPPAPYPTDQRRRRACHRHPSAGGTEPASAFAHRCMAAVVIAAAIGLVRGHRPRTNLSDSATGVLAVDGLLGRRGGARSDSRNRPGNRDRRRSRCCGTAAIALRPMCVAPMVSTDGTTSQDIRRDYPWRPVSGRIYGDCFLRSKACSTNTACQRSRGRRPPRPDFISAGR